MGNRVGGLEPYVPRVASDWDLYAEGSLWRAQEGSLVFVDISGFTNLSERLAQRGRIGAEELTAVLNRVFGNMLEIVYARGGSLLKFGGDALLLLFESHDHVMQACAATVEMRRALREASKEKTSVGRIDLKMSSGIHTGSVDFFLVGDSHRELIVTGPTASTTTEMEETADAGEIVISEAVKAELPADFTGDAKGRGWILRKRVIHCQACGPVFRESRHDPDLRTFVPKQLRTHLESGIAEAEHRIATIGFLKFKGVDSMLSEEGPETVGKALDELVTVVQEAVDDEGVTFLASDIDADGGKIILGAGVPTSQHDDEGRVLRAARRIIDAQPRLSIRVGVNRGHVFSGNVGTEFRQTFTVMGDTVNLAARLMAAAEPGMLYAAPSPLNFASTLFRTEPLEAFYVKGKEHPVQAFAVFEETGTRPPEIEADLPFHGREPELEMLVGIVNTCSRVGRGGIMTISGETGVGKSRLIQEVLDRCSGMDTLILQAEPSGIDNPYWAFRDPLRRMLRVSRGPQEVMAAALAASVTDRAPGLAWALPLLGDVTHIEIDDNERTRDIDPRFRPERTADVLIELLSAGHTRPVALVAEDGQWLDEASHQLLQRIGTAAEQNPWTVLVTARRSENEFEPMGDEILLHPLDESAMRSIAIEYTQATPLRPHELDSVVAKADGNPLFLGEILRVVSEVGSADELPDSLDAVISSEIDTLQPLPRQVLRYCSVLGRRFRRPVLRDFLEPERIEFDDATIKQLSRFIESEGEERLAFRHSVVHDIAYESLPYAKRRELHARAGDVIERQAGKDPESVAEYLSTHYSQSGEYQKAWKYARIAAEKAKHAYANAEAAAHYERAVDAARHLDAVEPTQLSNDWLALGSVRELAGELEASRTALSQALSMAEGNAVQRASIYLQRAGTWMNSGNLSQAKRAVTLGRRGLDSKRKHHTNALARLDAFEASIHAAKGDPQMAGELARRSIERAEASGEDEALARAYNVLDFSNFMLGKDEPRYGPKAIEIYNRLGFTERSVNVINNLGAYAYWEGDWQEAVSWYQDAIEAAERSGNVMDEALARTNIAEVLIGQRRYSEAASLLDESRRVYEASNAEQYAPLVGLLSARIQLGNGDTDTAATELSNLGSDESGGMESPWATEIVTTWALALVRSDQPKEAIEVLDNAGLEGGAANLRVRGLASISLGQEDAGIQLLRDALATSRDEGDLYEELLALDAINSVGLRTGMSPGPKDKSRLSELQHSLGVAAEALAS